MQEKCTSPPDVDVQLFLDWPWEMQQQIKSDMVMGKKSQP